MKTTSDALDILEKEGRDDPEFRQMLREEELYAQVAEMVYKARKKAKLTQDELAKLVGTGQSAISRIEDADYGARSLAVLLKIAFALGARFRPDLNPKREQFGVVS